MSQSDDTDAVALSDSVLREKTWVEAIAPGNERRIRLNVCPRELMFAHGVVGHGAAVVVCYRKKGDIKWAKGLAERIRQMGYTNVAIEKKARG